MFRKTFFLLGTLFIVYSLPWPLTTQGPVIGVREAWADPYFNSSEAMCNASDSTILFCDDLEDGNWAQSVDNETLAANDGWLMSPFVPVFPDPQGTQNARCGSKGAVGTNCAATTGIFAGGVDVTAGFNGWHFFYPNHRGVSELYLRFYVKFLPGYTHGHDKFLLFDTGTGFPQYMFIDFPFGSDQPRALPVAQDQWLDQNQGNAVTFVNGRWYYFEVHMLLNTPGQSNGTLEWWIDDCGTNGLGCTGPGTLRLRYTNVNYRTSSSQITSIRFHAWSGDVNNVNPAACEGGSPPGNPCEYYWDQIVVATRRIGPMGAVNVSPVAPNALKVKP